MSSACPQVVDQIENYSSALTQTRILFRASEAFPVEQISRFRLTETEKLNAPLRML